MTTLMQGFIQVGGHPLAHGLMHALGWTLLHFCWQGLLVAGVLWCVLGLLGGRSSQARYGTACCALVLIVVAPMFTFAKLATAEYRLVQVSTGVAVAIDPGMILWVGAGEPTASWPMRMVMAVDHWVPWVLLAWFAGVVLYVGRLNLGLIVAHRMKSRDTHPPPVELQRVFEGLRRRLGIARAVRLVHSARVQVPTVIGWLRPVVLIPVSCLTGLSADQIEAIFCHELAHVRRHDYLVSVFQSVVEALLFYHPAVWWVSKQVRRERECCCDEMAVDAGGDVLAYARALSYLEERRARMPEFVLGANGGVLKMRIKRLLGSKEDVAGSPIAALALLTILVATVGGCVSMIARAESRPAVREVSPVELEPPAVLDVQLAAPPARNVRLAMPAVRDIDLNEPTVAQAEPPVVPVTPPRGPVRVSSGVMAGNMGTVVNPVYPAEAKAKHVQGVVILHAIISKTGDIENLEVISGPELLRQSAIDAVGRWRYKPYLLNGEPTEVETTINVNYTFSAPQSPSPMSMPAEGSPPAVVGAPGQTIGPVRVSGGVAAGMLILKVDPVYPQDAKDAHVQGAVVLRAIISKTGTIRDLQVVSGPPELTDSAKDAVNQWRYKPYLLNGEPTEVETTITVNYSFDDSAMGIGPSPQGNNSGLAVRKIGGGVSAPLVIHQVPPEYSAEAKAAKFNGIVLVNLIVDEKGMPKNVHVLRGVGNGLDEKAVESVKKYRFRPAREGGKPVPVELNVEVNFQIF